MEHLNIAFTLALPATTDDTNAVRQHSKAVWAMLMEHVNKTLVSVCSWISINVTEPLRHALHQKIDEDNLLRAWGSTNVNSWYKNENGRVTQNWPGSSLEFWKQSKQLSPEDYYFS